MRQTANDDEMVWKSACLNPRHAIDVGLVLVTIPVIINETAALLVALMMEANPNLTSAEIEHIMRYTGTPVYDSASGRIFVAVNPTAAILVANGGVL